MMDGTEHASVEQMPSNEVNVFGEQKIPPRIGDEYQVEIPDLIMKTCYNHHEAYRPLDADSCGASNVKFTVMEEEIFTLALYVFERNFFLVKDFIGESRTMGEILAHFYGAFYGSERYHKWSECRKRKTRKCAYGAKIFTGLRLQQLLSRLLPILSDDDKGKLQEVSRFFEEGKMLFDKYVLTVRDMVGLNNLVDAVGVGKGKQDLTSTVMEPKIPLGKACSKLSLAEIVDVLQSVGRLSKAKSNDLFWEAVWPLLLANGWHSEQTRNSLVFLVPGVNKFSRRKLVKGSQYFDSVNDVLRKVALEPALLNIEAEIAADITNDETVDQEDLPNKKERCFLKLSTLSRGADVVKFTIVDTTAANGGSGMLRELREFPDERNNIRSDVQNTQDQSYLNFSMVEANISKPFKRKSSKKVSFILRGVKAPAAELQSNSQDSKKISSKRKSVNSIQETGAMKFQSEKQKKPADNANVDRVYKRRKKLSSCHKVDQPPHTKFVRTESSDESIKAGIVMEEPELINVNSPALPGVAKCSEPETVGIESAQNVQLSEQQEDGTAIVNVLPQKPQHMDPNLAIMPAFPENSEPGTVGNEQGQNVQSDEQHEDGIGLVTAASHSNVVEQEFRMDSRRQSGRKRVMSTRAVESLALGFMDSKRRR